MSAAAELLSTGSHSVKEVAFRLGYEDVSSFILVFKKYAGVLPGSIKKKSTSTITEVKNMFFLKP